MQADRWHRKQKHAIFMVSESDVVVVVCCTFWPHQTDAKCTNQAFAGLWTRSRFNEKWPAIN